MWAGSIPRNRAMSADGNRQPKSNQSKADKARGAWSYCKLATLSLDQFDLIPHSTRKAADHPLRM